VEPGDIITRFGGKKVEKFSDLPRLVGNTKPGTQSSLEVWRRGQAKSLSVNVAELEPERTAAAPSVPEKAPVEKAVNWLGLSVTGVEKSANKKGEGVLVSGVKGPAERAGLRQGDIILSVNNTQIASVQQFAQLVERLDRKKVVAFLVRRGEGVLFVPVRP
jgi:serine protease Do